MNHVRLSQFGNSLVVGRHWMRILAVVVLLLGTAFPSRDQSNPLGFDSSIETALSGVNVQSLALFPAKSVVVSGVEAKHAAAY